MSVFQNNKVNGKERDVDFDVEMDEAPFLSMTVTDSESGQEILDLFISDPAEAEYFFKQVAEAKEKWDVRQS